MFCEWCKSFGCIWNWKLETVMGKSDVYLDDRIIRVNWFKIVLIIKGFIIIMVVGLVLNIAWKLLFY